MMARYLIIFTVLFWQSLSSQNNFNFVVNDVKIKFNINTEGDYIVENIEIKNLSSKEIFIPNMNNKRFFFFSLGNRLHSYLGILNSMLGAPNLGGQIKLAKIKPKEIYTLKVNIKKGEPIKYYSFSLDFLPKKYKRLVKCKKGVLWIDTLDYVESAKYFYHKQD